MKLPTEKIKLFFLYLFTLVGLVLTLVGSVQLLNLGLRTYVFTKADYSYCQKPYPSRMMPRSFEEFGQELRNYEMCKEQQSAEKQRDAAQSLAFLIVGLPVFWGFYKQTKK